MPRGFDQPRELIEAAHEAEEDRLNACGRGEHEFRNVTDWEGDPDVINGTRTFYYKECRNCGTQADWDGRPEEPDPDDARDRAIEDRELFGDGHADDIF